MSTNKPFFSLIVPVYQAERYIEECFDSISSQIFTDFEVIVIDDGSTDSSSAICDLYQKKDGRFIVTHKSNEGVSAARNMGIEKSNGQYIMFIDADDRLENNALSVIRTACDNQNNPDIVMFNYYENIDSSGVQRERSYFECSEYRVYKHDSTNEQDRIEYLQKSILSPKLAPRKNSVYSMGVPWGKAYRGKLLRDSQIRFNTRLVLNEDVVFNIQIFQLCSCIVYLEDALYHYRIFDSSSMRKLNTDYTRAVTARLNIISTYEGMQSEYKNLSAAFEEKKYSLLMECLYCQKRYKRNDECRLIKKQVYHLLGNALKNDYFTLKEKARLLFNAIKYSVLSIL